MLGTTRMMDHIVWAGTTVCVICILCGTRAEAAQSKSYRELVVLSPNLEVLSAPSTSARVVATLTKGQTVRGFEVAEEWLHIDTPSEGWVFGPALSGGRTSPTTGEAEDVHIKVFTSLWVGPWSGRVAWNIRWIYGDFPVSIINNDIVLPSAEPGHAVYLEGYVPGLSVLGYQPSAAATGDVLIMKEDGWHLLHRWEPDTLGLPHVSLNNLTRGMSERGIAGSLVLPKDYTPAPSPDESLLPKYSTTLQGEDEVLIRNPNPFVVIAGMRSGDKGQNIMIPPNARRSTKLPDGKFQMFYVYTSKQGSVVQGDDFTVAGPGVEIRITEVAGGK